MSSQRMNIMVIGSPRPAEPTTSTVPGETARRHLRDFAAVKEDIKTIYQYCLKTPFKTSSSRTVRSTSGTARGRSQSRTVVSSNVKIHSLWVSQKELIPRDSDFKEKLEGREFDYDIFQSKDEVRVAVQEFLEQSENDTDVPNLMIYYSGHGKHEFNEDLQRSEEALVFYWTDPRGARVVKESSYTDSELTEDINDYLPSGKNLYLVIDACNSEGMLNLWELRVRQEKNVVLFAGANTDISAAYDARGGVFTRYFCHSANPGVELCEIEQAVLDGVMREAQREGADERQRQPKACYGAPRLQVAKYLSH